MDGCPMGWDVRCELSNIIIKFLSLIQIRKLKGCAKGSDNIRPDGWMPDGMGCEV